MTQFRLSMLMIAPAIAIVAPAAAQAPGAPATVPIAVSSFDIVPSTIHLAAGQPVRLVFSNTSRSSHDFTAPAFFARAAGVTGPIERGEVELAGHSSATVMLIPARGTYKAKCSHFGHAMLGMSATIVVD